jgi:phosphoglycolate phosphatase-like HAD superfamily hydrolase
MSGRTDPLIIGDACRQHQVAADGRMAELLQLYFSCLTEELPKPAPGKRVLPGVVPLLEALRRDRSAVLALLTGNFSTSARLKLEHFRLWDYFETGAFGDEAPERNGLVAVALERVRALGHGAIPPRRTVIIGDTPHDVACAAAAGARCVAVATGMAAPEELRAAGADVVLPDLGQTDEVLATIEALVEAEPLAR